MSPLFRRTCYPSTQISSPPHHPAKRSASWPPRRQERCQELSMPRGTEDSFPPASCCLQLGRALCVPEKRVGASAVSSPRAQDSRTSTLQSREPRSGAATDSMCMARLHVDLWALTHGSPRVLPTRSSWAAYAEGAVGMSRGLEPLCHPPP